MVEPSFLALTTTPSITLSLAELTSPDSAAAACAKAGEAAGNSERSEARRRGEQYFRHPHENLPGSGGGIAQRTAVRLASSLFQQA